VNVVFSAQFIGAITTIEIAYMRVWNQLWLECEFHAFKSQLAIPWKLRNFWNNCLYFVRNMYFVISHIYRKENYVADKLANFIFDNNDSLWFDTCPILFLEVTLLVISLVCLISYFLNIGKYLFVSPSYVSLSIFILSLSRLIILVFLLCLKKILFKYHIEHIYLFNVKKILTLLLLYRLTTKITCILLAPFCDDYFCFDDFTHKSIVW
jgi:hypothetical protein